MTTKDNALRMAIEFIENVFDGEWNWPFDTESPIKSRERLIEALEAALSDAVTLPDGWVAVPCKGENCGTTNNNHSQECMNEHEECYKTSGNKYPEFRYAGYKGQSIPNPHNLEQFEAYAEGVKARLKNIAAPTCEKEKG